MSDNVLMKILAYSSLPVIAAIVGGTIAAFRPPNAKLRSMIQHFAAGVVFSVVAVELLPDIVREHKPLYVVVGFGLGVLVMLGIRAFTGDSEKATPEITGRLPTAMFVAIAVDILVDGFLVGLGFAAGEKEGKLLTIALAIELLSLGLAVAVAMHDVGSSRAKTIGTIFSLSLLIVIGAALGGTLLHGLSVTALEVVLSFGLAALLFLVTEELLVEAHEEPETPLITATFFAGFLLFLILGMI